MKNKTKKTVLMWAIGLVYAVVVGSLTWMLDINLGLTAFPALVSALGWILTKSFSITKWLGW